MIKNLIKLVLLLVAGILIYNYFFGTEQEKETSKTIFSEVKDLGKATWDLLKSEKQKLDEGKYDQAMDKIEDLFQSLKRKAQAAKDSGALERLKELENQREDLQRRLEATDLEADDAVSRKEKERIRQDWKSLLDETERLMNEMEQ